MTRGKAILIAVAALVVGFGMGFVWQYVRAERLEAELTEARRDLEFQRLATLLAGATLEAQTGSYEAARRMASDFFTGLQRNADRAPQEAQPEMRAILAERDSTITVLSRGAPQSEDMLASLLLRYRLAWEGAADVAEPAQPAPQPTQPTQQTPVPMP